MKPEEVKEYYKNGYQFNKSTKMSANSLANWLRQGYVPFMSQKKIEELTEGELSADWEWKKHE